MGASRERAPEGDTVDHNRIQLGGGTRTFERAARAVREWRMFDIGWLELCWPDASIEVGTTVAVLASHFGFYSLNACRVVYGVDEGGPVRRFGFSYGTLPDHFEIGEERFTVEFHSEDETVWYDIYAFSRPGPLARAAYPISRALQKRFAQDSLKAMHKAASS